MTDFGADPPQPAGRRATRRRWPYFLFGPLLALLLTVVALALFLRTDYGLQRLESFLNFVLADVRGQSIVLSGLHGRFPFDLRLEGLRLADAEGIWLEIDDLALRWSGRDLLSARLRVMELSAQRLKLFRLPLTEAQDPKEPFRGLTLPHSFPRVVVERLAVAEIVLAEALAGKRTLLRLDADLNSGEHGLNANLHLATLEGLDGLLALRIAYNPAQDILDLAARFDDPQGGLAPLLGLPKATPLRLLLDGDGHPAAWSGTFLAQAGDLIELDSSVNLKLHKRPDLTWAGQISVAPELLPEPVSAYLPPQTEFEFVLSLPEPNLLRLERMDLENPRLRALLLADLNLGQAELLGGKLTLELTDTSPLNAIAGMDLGPSIQLDAEASGHLTGPDIRLGLTLQDLVVEPARSMRIATLRLDADTRFHRDKDLVIAASGSVHAQGLDLPGLGLPKALAESLSATFDLAWHQKDSLLVLHSLNLLGQGLEARADGKLDLNEMRLAGKLRLLPTELRPWLAPRKLDYQGTASLDLAARGTLWPLDLRLDVQTALQALRGLPDPLSATLGEAVALNATILLSPPAPPPSAGGGGEGRGLGPILVRELSLRGKALGLDAEAMFTPETKILDATARLELPDLSRVVPSPKLGLSGSLVMEAHARGSLADDLSLEAVLSSDNFAMTSELKRLEAFPLRAVIRADRLPGAPTGKISITTSPMKVPLELQSDFALREDVFRFSKFLLTLPQGRVTGQGRLNLDSKMVTARLQGRVTNIAPLAQLAGQDLRGALDFQLGIVPARPKAQASGNAEKLNADLSLNLRGFGADFGSLDSLSIRVQARDLLAKPALSAEIGLQGFSSGQARVDTLMAEASGSPRQLNLSASARGHALHPFNLKLRGAWEEQAPARVARVINIDGAWANQPLSLAAPVSVSIADKGLTLSPVLLKLGQSVIRGQASIEDHEADLRLGVEKLPLELFTAKAQGTLTAGVVLSGPKSALAGHLTVLGESLSPKIPQINDSLAMDLHAEAELNNRGLTFTAALYKSGGELTPLLQAGGQVPLRLALEPVSVNLPGDAQLSAFARGEMDLRWLGELLLPETHHLDGALNLDLRLSGTLNEPRPTGQMKILGAVYQHLHQGTLLQNINALATLERDQIRLREFVATDKDQGRLSIQGRVDLDSKQNFPFRFTVQAANLNILDSPLAQARLAEVALDLSGSTAAQEIKGHLTFDRVEVFLRELGGPRVVELPVVEINVPDDLLRLPAPRPRSTPPNIDLDLELRFPARVFARGRGLDSEWGGRLHVSGNVNQPLPRGEIRLVRGHLEMLGKRFVLSRESVIQFVGAHPPTPFVNIRAERQGRDHLFFLSISGFSPDIEVRPGADPPLPEDEVLPQLLFGRDLSVISPFQAARLALAVRELAGYGADLDVLGKARDLLLLDDLELILREGGVGLRAGKYVHERVYMRLERDLKTGEEQVSVNVELTPRVGLESKIGSKGGGLGLFWRHDY